MFDHILIRAGTRKPYKDVPELPPRAVYDMAAGYWILEGTALVSLDGNELGPIASKKADLETGEDQKSE